MRLFGQLPRAFQLNGTLEHRLEETICKVPYTYAILKISYSVPLLRIQQKCIFDNNEISQPKFFSEVTLYTVGKYLIVSKFRNDRIDIVDFLIKAYFC